MSSTSYTTQRAVAVITLQNPPVNGLGHEVRLGIVEGLDRAAADPAVQAVVLVGSGKAFSGGADIREFNTPRASAEPTLGSVIRAVEASPKPVVAAIHGVAMGGGLELALGCHYRVASPGAQVALPEVKLGILPGAGGTQRLPRVLGLEAALNLVVSGESVAAEKLAGTALFDAILEGDLVAGAVAFAEKVVQEKRPLALVRQRKVEHPNPEGFLAFAKAAVAGASKGLPAPGRCVEAVAAAVSKPFEEGLKVEREAFQHLVQTSESKTLRHAFLAERTAAKIPDVPDAPTRPIRAAAVVGAGTMGGGIAMSFASAGIPVTVLEVSAQALEKGLATIRKNYEGNVKKGRITPAQLEERMALVRPTTSHAEIAQADIVVEAVFEDMGVKEKVFRQLDEVMKPGAILATNTSTLDVDQIAAFTRRPHDVVGTHFFSPANVMKLLEVVRAAKTGVDVLATVMALSKRLKKVAVVSGVCDGFIGNRMLAPYQKQAMFLLEEGATPQQVDRALEKWGMAMGPFRMGDLAGLDIGWAIRKRRYVERPQEKFSRVGDRVCERGRFGQKTGAGWYRYEAGKRDAIPDPVVEELIAAYSAELGVARRKISDEEIVERCIFALVNEGARIVEEGIALRASDVDVVYLNGYGFPAARGGPMQYADSVGLFHVLRAMNRFASSAHGDPTFWKPAALIARLAAEGKSFNS